VLGGDDREIAIGLVEETDELREETGVAADRDPVGRAGRGEREQLWPGEGDGRVGAPVSGGGR
jgi:hypothetical protein